MSGGGKNCHRARIERNDTTDTCGSKISAKKRSLGWSKNCKSSTRNAQSTTLEKTKFSSVRLQPSANIHSLYNVGSYQVSDRHSQVSCGSKRWKTETDTCLTQVLLSASSRFETTLYRGETWWFLHWWVKVQLLLLVVALQISCWVSILCKAEPRKFW